VSIKSRMDRARRDNEPDGPGGSSGRGPRVKIACAKNAETTVELDEKCQPKCLPKSVELLVRDVKSNTIPPSTLHMPATPGPSSVGATATTKGAATGVGSGRRKRKTPDTDSGGAKPRKTPDADASVKHELDELREWRRRAEEKEKQLNVLFSASSSCIVCLDVRPDLISYGACGHMVCCSCALDHVTRTLMVMRRRSQNTGCKARLSHFALNVEDSEFSCPMCRQGQLDLMGAGLSLLPDFAYYQLALYCTSRNSNATMTTITPPLLKAPPPPLQQPQPQPQMQLLAQLSGGQADLGLSSGKRALVLAEIERNRLSAQRALASQVQLQEHAHIQRHQKQHNANGVELIRCHFCGIVAAQPGEKGPDKLLPSELLRHIWRCRKRTFICGFADCQRTFSWESVYQSHAPSTVGSIGDFKNEAKWLKLVNAAFSDHMKKDCQHKTLCCIGWCDYNRTPATIPLCQFQQHEAKHKSIHNRFQEIGKIADSAIRVERILAAVLRHEFNALVAQTPDAVPTNSKVAPHVNVANQSLLTGSVPNQPGLNQFGPLGPSCAVPIPPSTNMHQNHKNGGGDVMVFAGPIAREVHNSLDTLHDLLRTHIASHDSGKASKTGGRNELGVGLTNLIRCHLHDDNGSTMNGSATGSDTQPSTHRARTRSETSSFESVARDLASSVDANVSLVDDQVLAFTSDEDPEEDDDDDDYVPPVRDARDGGVSTTNQDPDDDTDPEFDDEEELGEDEDQPHHAS
jgi:hypothetical protein